MNASFALRCAQYPIHCGRCYGFVGHPKGNTGIHGSARSWLEFSDDRLQSQLGRPRTPRTRDDVGDDDQSLRLCDGQTLVCRWILACLFRIIFPHINRRLGGSGRGRQYVLAERRCYAGRNEHTVHTCSAGTLERKRCHSIRSNAPCVVSKTVGEENSNGARDVVRRFAL